MDGLLIPLPVLALLCFGITVAYASVGLGGGTAYTALLAILGAGYQMIPTISLLLNVVVTTIGSLIFLRARHGRLSLIVPFVSTSVPTAYVGGLLPVSPDLFYGVLWGTLVLVVVRIFVWDDAALDLALTRPMEILLSLVLGTGLGLVAGIVGIGGGIYLVPLILILGLGTEREAAAAGAVFTWTNSVAGLAARVQRLSVDWVEFAPLAGAVGRGGRARGVDGRLLALAAHDAAGARGHRAPRHRAPDRRRVFGVTPPPTVYGPATGTGLPTHRDAHTTPSATRERPSRLLRRMLPIPTQIRPSRSSMRLSRP
ncbi:MAG: TSUP family transporter [Salinibacter sp.]